MGAFGEENFRGEGFLLAVRFEAPGCPAGFAQFTHQFVVALGNQADLLLLADLGGHAFHGETQAFEGAPSGIAGKGIASQVGTLAGASGLQRHGGVVERGLFSLRLLLELLLLVEQSREDGRFGLPLLLAEGEHFFKGELKRLHGLLPFEHAGKPLQPGDGFVPG